MKSRAKPGYYQTRARDAATAAGKGAVSVFLTPELDVMLRRPAFRCPYPDDWHVGTYAPGISAGEIESDIRHEEQIRRAPR